MSSLLIKCATSSKELEQILELQQRNYVHNLSATEKETNGFVTVKHSFSVLQKMNDKAPQIIAVDLAKVIGYALVMPQETKVLVPILAPMFALLDSLSYNNKPIKTYHYYVMGQICIAKAYRGQGLFRKLYQKHKETYAHTYDFCITEVASTNLRSLQSHLKIGFSSIHTFTDETDTWNILLWDWK